MQTITVTELITPPEALLTPCEKPVVTQMQTNDDLIRFASLALLKWEQCAAQVEGLREFFGLDKDDQKTLSTDATAGEPH